MWVKEHFRNVSVLEGVHKSSILMEEYKLSAFEKMLLKTLFVTKGDEVTE
jgi:hypothetical protein